MGRFPALLSFGSRGEIFCENTPESSLAVTLQLLLRGLVYHFPVPDPQLGTPELLGHTLTIKSSRRYFVQFLGSSLLLGF